MKLFVPFQEKQWHAELVPQSPQPSTHDHDLETTLLWIDILVTLTVVDELAVTELTSAVQVYSPACEVLRELNISTREYVGPDPVISPTVKSVSVEITMSTGALQVMEGAFNTIPVTVQVIE